MSSLPHSCVPVEGRRLAYSLRSLTPAQRAVAAANADGLMVIHPTDRQTASLFRVSTVTLNRARRLDPNTRQQVAAGKRSLAANVDDAALDRMLIKIGPERV